MKVAEFFKKNMREEEVYEITLEANKSPYTWFDIRARLSSNELSFESTETYYTPEILIIIHKFISRVVLNQEVTQVTMKQERLNKISVEWDLGVFEEELLSIEAKMSESDEDDI